MKTFTHSLDVTACAAVTLRGVTSAGSRIFSRNGSPEVTHLSRPATSGKRSGFTASVRTLPLRAFALLVVAVVSGTVAMANVPASWLGGAAAEPVPQQETWLQAAVVPALVQEAETPKARPRRSGCASCGVVETIHRIEAAGNLPAAFEFTVRMRDGSTRVSSSATQDKWRSGDRIMFIGDIAPPIPQ
jgi:hypothetical protein